MEVECTNVCRMDISQYNDISGYGVQVLHTVSDLLRQTLADADLIGDSHCIAVDYDAARVFADFLVFL